MKLLNTLNLGFNIIVKYPKSWVFMKLLNLDFHEIVKHSKTWVFMKLLNTLKPGFPWNC